MQNIDELVNLALVAYLQDQGISATMARFSDTNIPRGGGCDTCGYGGDNDLTFDILYRDASDTYWDYHTVQDDPLNFFTTLYPYIDGAR